MKIARRMNTLLIFEKLSKSIVANHWNLDGKKSNKNSLEDGYLI